MSDDIANLAREVVALEDISGTWRDQAMLKLARAYLSTVTPPGSGEDIDAASNHIADAEKWLSTQKQPITAGRLAGFLCFFEMHIRAAERDRCARLAFDLIPSGDTARRVAAALRDAPGGG